MLPPAPYFQIQEKNMPIAQMLLPEFDQEMANTRKMLERVPDGKFDYKPHEKSMKLGRLAAHTAEIPSWVAGTLRTERMDFTGEEKPFSPATRKEIARCLRQICCGSPRSALQGDGRRPHEDMDANFQRATNFRHAALSSIAHHDLEPSHSPPGAARCVSTPEQHRNSGHVRSFGGRKEHVRAKRVAY